MNTNLALAQELRRSARAAEALYKRMLKDSHPQDDEGACRQAERKLDQIIDDYDFLSIEATKLKREIKELRSERSGISADVKELKTIKAAISCLSKLKDVK